MARGSVTGGKQIASRLTRMATAITPNVVRNAHEAALNPMRDEARFQFVANGSDKGGGAPEQIAVEHVAKHTSVMGLTKHLRKIGHLIELGTAPHMFGGRMHPGASPKPFIRPAFERQQYDAISEAGQVYLSALTKSISIGRKKNG